MEVISCLLSFQSDMSPCPIPTSMSCTRYDSIDIRSARNKGTVGLDSDAVFETKRLSFDWTNSLFVRFFSFVLRELSMTNGHRVKYSCHRTMSLLSMVCVETARRSVSHERVRTPKRQTLGYFH